MKNYAYVTYLGTNDYLIGTLALINELKSVESKYPIYVLVSSNLNEESIKLIKQNGAKVLETSEVEIPVEIKKRNEKLGYSRWNFTFEKLQVFNLDQFDKIIMLDSDMLVKRNIDKLFEKPSLSAVCAGDKYPKNIDWKGLNSGIVVIKPNKKEFLRLVELIDVDTPGDQDVIQKGNPDWNDDNELHLDESYNVISSFEAYYVGILKYKNIKIIHFTHRIKPWKMTRIYRIKYVCSIIFRQLRDCRTLRGVNNAVSDFLHYCQICDKLKASINEKDVF